MCYLSIPKGDGCVIMLEKRYLYNFATNLAKGFSVLISIWICFFQVSGLGVPAKSGFWNLSSFRQLGLTRT